MPGLVPALAQLIAPHATSIAMPTDAVCCVAASAGSYELRVAPLASVKVRGRLSDAAVACVLQAVASASGIASGISAVKLVRYSASASQCRALVEGLQRASVAAIELSCKRGVVGPDGVATKAKLSWRLRSGGEAVEVDVGGIATSLSTSDV